MSNTGEPAAPSAPHRNAWMWAGLVAAAILIVGYFLLVVMMAPGGAFGDDLDIDRSVEAARRASNPWPDLWALHNEHRLVITRLAFWAQRAVMGAPDYTVLAIIGNLFLLPIFAILAARAWSGHGLTAGAAVLFAAAMTFSYSSADSMLWAMAALSNYGVTAFAALAFWMLAQGKPGWGGAAWTAGALAMALAAALSQGNGLLALGLGATFLLLGGRWVWAAIWTIVSAGMAAAYFAGGDLDSLASLGRPLDALLFSVVVSGSALGYPVEAENIRLAFFVACGGLGVALWGLVAYGFARSRFLTRDPLLWFAAFLIGSGFLAALARMDGGLIQALTPRYHINSLLLIACCILVLVTGARETWGRLSASVRWAMPLFALAGLAYVGVSTLTLWRMHTFYAEHVGGR